MPALLQVMALAAMAFLASALLSRDHRRVSVLSLYVLAGALIGPLGIGLFDDISQELLAPALSLAVTWMGWLHGMRLFDRRASRPSGRVAWAALLEAGAVIVAVTLGLHFGAPFCGASLPLISAAAIGIALAGSTYFAVELSGDRPTESGSRLPFLERVSNLDCLVPIVGLIALLFFLPASEGGPLSTSSIWAPAVSVIALGLMMGLVFLLAAGRRAPLGRGWLVLLGAAILSAGVAGQLGIPELVVGFVAGAVVTQSVGGRRISDVVASSERPVALLIALLVGMRVSPDQTLLLLAAGAVGLWIASRIAVARPLRLLAPRDGSSRLAFLGYGGFPLAVAAQIALTDGGWIGALALTSAAALCVASDALGAYTILRRRHEPFPAETASAGGASE